jgi:hypothetical protein
LIITTAEAAPSRLETRLYPIYDLPLAGIASVEAATHAGPESVDGAIHLVGQLGGMSGMGQGMSGMGGMPGMAAPPSADLRPPTPVERLEIVIGQTIAPESWSAVGGPGSMRAMRKPALLVVSQTEEVHRQLGELLTSLRKVWADMPAEPQPDPNESGLKVYKLTSGNFGTQPTIPEEDVVRLIRKLVEPESWEQEGVVLEKTTRRIVVRHTQRVHEQIRRLLARLGLEAAGTNAPESGGGGFGGGGGLFALPDPDSSGRTP